MTTYYQLNLFNHDTQVYLGFQLTPIELNAETKSSKIDLAQLTLEIIYTIQR